LFAAARVATTVAFQMVGVAVGWQIYELTKSAFDLGLVGLAQFVPMVLLVLVVGHVADRYDRRTIARLCQLAMGLAVAVLAVATLRASIAAWTIYVLVIVLGAARAFETPTLQALVPMLVSNEMLPAAMARWASANQSATIIGPALGGVLYALAPWVVYASAAVLFVVAVALITAVRARRVTVHREPPTLRSLFGGIHFIREHPVVLGAISLDLFAVLLGGATALLPVYARDILHTGPWGLGLLRSAPAAGALGMSWLLGHRPLGAHVGRTMFAAVGTFGIATMLFALSRWFVVSLCALAILGAADVISVVIRSTLVQLQTPDAMRGRVSAVNSLFVGTSNQLGEFESGVTAAWFGAVPAVLIGGIGTILVAVLWTRLFPQLAAIDTLSNVAAREPVSAARRLRSG
jgi:MFS family permease